ncbi:39314_t:CDS:2, partial [Gigaspora margarita]
VSLVTSMSIMGHISESSYRIYARPSTKQKEDALSQLISSDSSTKSSVNDASSPLLTKNLPPHINARKPNLTLGGRQIVHKNNKPIQESQEPAESNDIRTVVKNY